MKSFDMTETFRLEIDSGEPGHEMKIPESTKTLFNIRLHKVIFTAVFIFPLLLEAHKLVEQEFFFSIDSRPEGHLEEAIKGPRSHQKSGIHESGEDPKIVH